MNKQYFIYLHNCKFEVSKKEYADFYKDKRRVKYLQEADAAHGVVSYQAKDSDDFSGEDYLVDAEQESVEEAVIKNIMLEKLREAMTHLSEQEIAFIYKVFSDDETQLNIGTNANITQQAISKRKMKIINKLRKIMGI